LPLRDRGRPISTGTHVEKIEGGSAGRVGTSDGHTVTCQGIVVATNSPVNDQFAIQTKHLLIILVILLLGGLPSWPYSRSWDYGPSGLLGILLVLLLPLLIFNVIP
jgi:hypothetical protein